MLLATHAAASDCVAIDTAARTVAAALADATAAVLDLVAAAAALDAALDAAEPVAVPTQPQDAALALRQAYVDPKMSLAMVLPAKLAKKASRPCDSVAVC